MNWIRVLITGLVITGTFQAEKDGRYAVFVEYNNSNPAAVISFQWQRGELF